MKGIFKIKHIPEIIIAAELCLAILLPLFNFNFDQNKISAQENRAVAKIPKLFDENMSLNKNLRGDAGMWFEDNLGLRDYFLRLNGVINYNLFNRSPVDKVELGKDDWLFYSAENNMELVDGNYPDFDEKALEFYCNKQIATKDRLAKQGIDYILVLPPSKVSIYPEYIAHGDYKVQRTAADIFADYIQQHSDIKVVRLKDVILQEKAKTDDLLFFKTDTHWTPKGKYVAYKEIIKNMVDWGLADKDHLQPEFYEDKGYSGDLAGMLGAVQMTAERDLLKEDYINWKFKDPKAYELKSGPRYDEMLGLAQIQGLPAEKCNFFINDCVKENKVLIYGDSMIGSHLLSAFAEDFSQLTFMWTYEFNQQVIDGLKPNTVILDVSERGLSQYMKTWNDVYLASDTHIDTSKKTLEVYYYDGGEYDSMYAPTWSEENDQDDLVWYEMKRIDANTWYVCVDLNEHRSCGKYYTHFYNGPNGVGGYVSGIGYNVEGVKFD